MTKFAGPPPLDGLKRRIANHRRERESAGGEQKRDFIYVDDVIQITLLFLKVGMVVNSQNMKICFALGLILGFRKTT